MNKKGFFGHFIFGFIGLAILILVLTVLIPIQNSNVPPERMIEIIDNSSNNLLNSSSLQINESNGVIVNVIYSFTHFIIYTSFEISKAAINYSVENPEVINAKNLLLLIIISLLIPIVYYGFMFCVIIFLLVKEWYLNRKEKLELKNLKSK